MEPQVVAMEGILKDELAVFEGLYSLEEEKTGAIMNHDGKLLEKISREQEGLISKIQALETGRIRRMTDYKRARHIKETITLKDMADQIAGRGGSRLMTISGNLKAVINRLNNLQKTNRTLINDNMEYYTILLKGLKDNRIMDSGYSPDGKEEETLKQSILFNQTA
ncbi:MAG: hypothetical protein A2W19_15755 [Spirochaetes bacterium RBG_16_49_21]|nr:MAG: hypothetical protein A2W19_15755 [Spirochaetes bacterium RBG_16_49_21]